jgi:hypothetical protein
MEEKCSGLLCGLLSLQFISTLMNEEAFDVLIASLCCQELYVYPVYPSTRDSYNHPKATPMPLRHLFYIHILSKSEVGAVIHRSEVTYFGTNAEVPSQIFYKVALFLFLLHVYDGACNSFNIPSYIPNMMAALGTVLKR